MKTPLIITAIILILLFTLNFFILKNTSEYHQHNVYGDTDNIVLLHPDGHEELVVDPDGNPVLTGSNASSYNFCNPSKDPVCHYLRDTRPWIKWGNTADDPTTKAERKAAFRRDYRDGFKRLIGLIE